MHRQSIHSSTTTGEHHEPSHHSRLRRRRRRRCCTTSGCAVTRGQESVGAYVDDAAITTAVKAKMVENKDVDAAAIKVETLNGTVMLSGFAKNSLEKSTAENIAMRHEGRQERQERDRGPSVTSTGAPRGRDLRAEAPGSRRSRGFCHSGAGDLRSRERRSELAMHVDAEHALAQAHGHAVVAFEADAQALAQELDLRLRRLPLDADLAD